MTVTEVVGPGGVVVVVVVDVEVDVDEGVVDGGVVLVGATVVVSRRRVVVVVARAVVVVGEGTTVTGTFAAGAGRTERYRANTATHPTARATVVRRARIGPISALDLVDAHVPRRRGDAGVLESQGDPQP